MVVSTPVTAIQNMNGIAANPEVQGANVVACTCLQKMVLRVYLDLKDVVAIRQTTDGQRLSCQPISVGISPTNRHSLPFEAASGVSGALRRLWQLQVDPVSINDAESGL